MKFIRNEVYLWIGDKKYPQLFVYIGDGVNHLYRGLIELSVKSEWWERDTGHFMDDSSRDTESFKVTTGKTIYKYCKLMGICYE